MTRRPVSDGSKRPNRNARRNAEAAFGSVCVHCGADLTAPGAVRHVDHWIPRSRFDLPCLRRWFQYRDRDFNLVASCASCNLRKHADLPARDHPLTVEFFLHCCAEEMAAAWESGAPVPLDVLAYWAAHEGPGRDWARLRMEDRKTDVCRRAVSQTFMDRNDNHFIAPQLLYSMVVGNVIEAFGHVLAVLCKGMRSACDFFCGEGEPMRSLGVQRHWWDEDVRFLAEIWPAHCELVARGLAMEPVPIWRRSPLVRLDEEYDMVDILCGCRE